METKNNLADILSELLDLEMIVCDSIYTDIVRKGGKKNPGTGSCKIHPFSDPGSILAEALAGKRVVSILADCDVNGLLNTLEAMNRLRTPAVFVLPDTSKLQIAKLADSGTIIIQSIGLSNIGASVGLAHEIAELELRPVILFILESHAGDIGSKLGKAPALPEASSVINSPSPLQELLFGKKRRRIPIWFNVDQVVALGSAKDRKELGLEIASAHEYSYYDLARRIAEIRKNAGLSDVVPAFDLVGKESSNKFIVADFSDRELLSKPSTQKALKNAGWTWIGISQLFPLPQRLEEILKNAREIFVLESIKTGRQGWFLKEIKAILPSTKLVNCIYNRNPQIEEIQALLNKLNKGKYPELFWLDIPLSIPGSTFPKHEVLLQHAKRLIPDIDEKSVGIGNGISTSDADNTIPLSIRDFTDRGAPYSRIGRFNDDVLQVRNTNNNEEFADPFRQLNAIPPATSLFLNSLRGQTYIPEFRASECTACGDCLINCPNNAIPAVMLKISDVLENAIKACNASGTPIRRFMPHRQHFRELLSDEVRLAGKEFDLANLARISSSNLIDALDLGKSETNELKDELDGLIQQLENYQFTASENWFEEYEKRESGSGLLFSLAFDPDTCTACGMCETSCEPGAIRMIEVNDRSESRMQQAYLQLNQLPDTAGETIRKLSAEKNFNPLAATFLSRHYTRSYHGGGIANDQIPERTIIRSFLAVGEQLLQTRNAQFRKRVQTCIPAISERIREQLSNAVPKGDLDDLMGSVASSVGKIPLEQILTDWKSATHLTKVDARSLRRKLQLLEDLNTLLNMLETGTQGSGRALYGLVLDRSLAYLNNYPWNPFSVPTLIAAEDRALGTAQALNDAQSEHILENIRILRRAELEAKGSYEPDQHDSEISSLTFEHLSEEERAFIPPVCLITTSASLLRESPENIARYLEGSFPIRSLVLETISTDSPELVQSDLFSAFSEVFLRRTAFLARIPFYRQADTYNHMLNAWSESKSSVFISPIPNLGQLSAHYSKWLDIAQFAEECRGFFSFVFRPSRAQKTIAQGLEIPQTLQYERIWKQISIDYFSEGADKQINYEITWADFARTIIGMKHFFRQIPHSEHCVPLADYLKLESTEKSKKVPVVVRKEEDGHLTWHAVDGQIVHLTGLKADQLHFALELAGLHSNFPEKIRDKMEKALRAEFETEKQELQRVWEQERAQLEQEMLQKVRADIKNRLVQLSAVSK